MYDKRPDIKVGDYLHASEIVWRIDILSGDGCWGWCDSETHGIHKFMILPVVDIGNQHVKGYCIKIGEYDVLPLTPFEYEMLQICQNLNLNEPI